MKFHWEQNVSLMKLNGTDGVPIGKRSLLPPLIFLYIFFISFHNNTSVINKIAWIETNYNIADAFTKRLTADNRDTLFGDWAY